MEHNGSIWRSRTANDMTHDKGILKLIKMWLKAPVEETDKDGGKRLTGGKRRLLALIDASRKSLRAGRGFRFEDLETE
jgi:hypothetical protein